MKPGNILIHESGHIRLADLGSIIDVGGDMITPLHMRYNSPIFNQCSKPQSFAKNKISKEKTNKFINYSLIKADINT